MKQDKRFDEIENLMKPGVITVSGFLGNDRRRLQDIIESDGISVTMLGLTHGGIAARMQEFREAGGRGMGYSGVEYQNHFTVETDAAMGRISCPFRHAGRYPKVVTRVINKRLNRSIEFSDLTIHMIEHHGFYGGKGSVYRCDPEDIAVILELHDRT